MKKYRKIALTGHYVAANDVIFGTTVNPIVYESGISMFIDIEYDTWNMNLVALEKFLKYIWKSKLLMHIFMVHQKNLMN